ncbi:MAG: hypothetical protein J5I93_15495 [Pirellulaceae bacterium]|nr:hypothetical protein [Pirellulaceae bacterium]
MNWFGQLPQQLALAWTSGSPGRRAALLLLAIVLAVALAAIAWRPPVERGAWLLDGREFSPQELMRIEAAFAQAGLNGWQIEQGRVRLPRAERHAYLAALAEHDALPDHFGSASQRLLDTSHWFEPSQVRALREKHAVERELALVVSRMAGIEMATVRYDQVDEGGFPVRKIKTAMVAAAGSQQRGLSESQVRSIRDLVAGAIAGLDAEHVTVTDLVTSRTYRGQLTPSTSDAQQQYLAAKRVLEDGWRDRIYDMLAMYPGAVVAVNVEPRADEMTAGPAAAQVVSASIAVPRSYLLQVWGQRRRLANQNGWPAAEQSPRDVELEVQTTIQRQVQALLPASDSPALAAPLVVVSTYDDLPTAETPAPFWSGPVAGWLRQRWQLAGLISLGILATAGLAIVLVWRRSRSTRLPPPLEPASFELTPGVGATGLDADYEQLPGQRHGVSEPTATMGTTAGHAAEQADALHSQLSALVRQNPGAAVRVLKQWMGEAA